MLVENRITELLQVLLSFVGKTIAKLPFNIVGYGTANVNTLIDETIFPALKSSDKYSYATQLLISRRFSDSFSFQIAPTYVRENLQNLNVLPEAKHNQYALGLGGRINSVRE